MLSHCSPHVSTLLGMHKCLKIIMSLNTAQLKRRLRNPHCQPKSLARYMGACYSPRESGARGYGSFHGGIDWPQPSLVNRLWQCGQPHKRQRCREDPSRRLRFTSTHLHPLTGLSLITADMRNDRLPSPHSKSRIPWQG